MGPYPGARQIIASPGGTGRLIKRTSEPADTLYEVHLEFNDLARAQSGHIRSIARQLLPGVALPGLIYLIVSRYAPVLVALAVASSVPVLDMAWRLLQGKRPTWAGTVFIGAAAISVGLAMVLHSPFFILVKGAVMSAILGLAFAISALIRRPLTRTLALRLSSDHPEGRRRLAERWRRPKAHAVFCTLSVAWGGLLLAMAGQQAALAVTVSPGMVMAVDGPSHALLTVLGIAWSILYVRRIQRRHPDLGLLPVRNRTGQ